MSTTHPPQRSGPRWLADPTGRHQHRYFDGSRWTALVADGGQVSEDSAAGRPAGPSAPPPRSRSGRAKRTVLVVGFVGGGVLLGLLVLGLVLEGFEDERLAGSGQTIPEQTVPPREVQEPTTAQAAPPATEAPTITEAQALRLLPLQVRDPAFDDIVAFTLLVPDGWHQQGGMYWRTEPLPFSVLDLVVHDPEGSVAVRFLPGALYSWSEGGLPGVEAGAIVSAGSINLPPPIDDPTAYVEQVLIPQHGADVHGLTIDSIEALPAVAAEAARSNSAPGLEAHGESYRVRLHFHAGGQAYEEDLYFTLLFYRLGGGAWSWQPVEQYGLIAARGHLDTLTPLLRTVAASSRVSPEWFAANQELAQRHVHHVLGSMQRLFESQQQIARELSQIGDLHHEAYLDRQASMDRIHDAFSQHIRGVQTYETPHGTPIELPAGYGNAWLNPATGEVILSNDHHRPDGFTPIYPR
jgi:hypothetical protein